MLSTSTELQTALSEDDRIRISLSRLTNSLSQQKVGAFAVGVKGSHRLRPYYSELGTGPDTSGKTLDQAIDAVHYASLLIASRSGEDLKQGIPSPELLIRHIALAQLNPDFVSGTVTRPSVGYIALHRIPRPDSAALEAAMLPADATSEIICRTMSSIGMQSAILRFDNASGRFLTSPTEINRQVARLYA